MCQHPDQPHRGAIHREGEKLAQAQHPGAGPGQDAQQTRADADQCKGCGKAEAECKENSECNCGRLCQRKAKRGRHERRGARRGHRHRQYAGEKGARGAALARQPLPRREARNLEHAGEVEPDREHQQREARNHHRLLQLEAPANRLPTRAQGDEKPTQRHHAEDGTGAVGETFTRRLPRVSTGGRGQRHRLHREDRQHTGHQIEDEAARKCEKEREQKAETGAGGGAVKPGGRHRAGRRLHLERLNRTVFRRQHQHTGERRVCGIGGKFRHRRQTQHDAILREAEGLRFGTANLPLRQREEIGFRRPGGGKRRRTKIKIEPVRCGGIDHRPG